MDSEQKDFNRAQVPTDSNMASNIAKPLGGQRIRFWMNDVFGYWHNEWQTRVGELEGKAYEEKKNFAGKVNKIAKMIVRIVTSKGLQPMVTEASTFIREIDQCKLEVEDSNRSWRITIIIVFAAMTLAMWRLRRYFDWIDSQWRHCRRARNRFYVQNQL